ncbi:gamma-glutamyltransferase [candidate division KSB1 bacterium]|nr:gamma-glutamyltransferase [candidate division KSB1 bacterium]
MVASAHPIASSVGLDILKRGGNAVDAAMAVAFALSIAEPNASGIGGGGFMMIKMADQQKAVMIDYREMALGKATSEFYYENDASFKELTTPGFSTSIGVPGLVACADSALKKFGTMTLSEILQPAIHLARHGIPVSEKLNGMIAENYDKISKYPATSAIYLSEMLPLEAGTILKNEDLAQSFEKIAQQGSDLFYEGDLAKAIVAEVQNQGGLFELSDLQSYQAKIRKPVMGSYRGYEIISAAPTTGGGTHLIELLNIMEGFEVRKLGHNSAQFVHIFTEAMKMVYADKSLNTADPDFFDVPVDSFINKNYAKKLREKIDQSKASFDYTPPEFIATESNSTSHLSIIDEHGNIVALTQSINNFFGSGIVVPGTGILLNDHLSDFDDDPGKPNSIAPYKRPTSSIAPTIILKDGKPFMSLGTPGGTRIISALSQIIMNVIDFGMSMDDAIEAPRVHCLTKILHVEGRIDQQVIETLKSMGHKIELHPNFDNYFGGAQGILLDSKSHRLFGGADSRRDGVAIGF